ncbi:hypothetical protein C0J52_12844 [Blattella germanica]|nr:hypothetical protein C0J52_12844 [Blattella germanica]
MITNRFAEEFDEAIDQDECCRLQVSNSSLKPASGSKRSRNSDSPRDFLANRVSFYMDDVLASSIDDVEGSAPDLRYQQNAKKSNLHRSLMTRERSFRMAERKPVRLARHTSDVCPGSRPQKLQRKRSANGSRRQNSRRGSYGGTVEKSDSRTMLRTGSYRSNGSGSGKMRRQDSNSTGGGSKRSSNRKVLGNDHHESGIKLPYKDLPPKERRRRIVVLMVVSTFLFLVVCSVLAVVVTLTHSSFNRNAYYLPDTAEHLYPRINYSEKSNFMFRNLRKENEEMVNAISRNEPDAYNDTTTVSSVQIDTQVEIKSLPQK